MKHSSLYTVIFALLSVSAAHAFLPDPPITLSDHIKISDHIFVGEAVDAYYVSNYGKNITPQQAAKQMGNCMVDPWIETKLKVNETLLSCKGPLPRYIYYRYLLRGAGYMQVAARPAGLARMLKEHKEYFRTPFIYFADSEKRPNRSIFYASYGITTGEEIKEKAKIKATIEDSTDSMRLLN